jgi:hypothetical protein
MSAMRAEGFSVSDSKGGCLLMRLALLGACAHLERDVDLTHWLVHAAWLRRRFESVGEQIRLQRK